MMTQDDIHADCTARLDRARSHYDQRVEWYKEQTEKWQYRAFGCAIGWLITLLLIIFSMWLGGRR